MNTEMALKFVGIWRCVCAMRALIWALPSVASHMTLQFGQFNRSIVAFGAAMGLFVCMTIANVSHQFSGCCKGGIAKFTLVRSNASVCIDMVLKRS